MSKLHERLKPVTLQQLQKWVKQNRHLGFAVDENSKHKPGFMISDRVEIRFLFETMEIDWIGLWDSHQANFVIQVDIYTRGEGNLLDALDDFFTEEGK